MALKLPETASLGCTPTPVELLSRLSKRLEGPDIYIKRDDLTGVGLTGNKVRKLAFLIHDAVQKNADVLITCGGVQSNHARATAVAAARFGLRSHLFLRKNGESTIDGNFFLDKMVGAEITFVDQQEYDRIDEVMHDLAAELAEKGQNAYVIPEGGSNALGALGYIRAAEEIAAWSRREKLRFDAIVCAVGSGGTYAGLLAGKYLYDLPARILGINVCHEAVYFRRKISSLLDGIRTTYLPDLKTDDREIRIIDGFVGKGYGLSRQEEIDIIKLTAEQEGILLDPVYTGKAMLGLQELIRRGEIAKDEKVLFLHSGGIFGLFPKRGLFY